MKRTIEIDVAALDLPTLEFEAEYSYSYDPGCISGKPEDCYPPEDEKEIWPVNSEAVIAGYIKQMAELLEQAILEHCDKNRDNCRDWFNEDSEVDCEP